MADGTVDFAELHAPVRPPGADPAIGARAGRRRRRQPVGRRALRQPDHDRRTDPHRRGRHPHHQRRGATAPWPTPPPDRVCSRTSCVSWKGRDGQGTSTPSSASGRRTTRRSSTGSIAGVVRDRGAARPRRRRHDVVGHRRRRHRQGPRLLRGRDDARAVPRRRARRGRQADVPGAHRRHRWAARPPSSPATSSRRACTSACSPSPSRSSPSPTPCGRCRCRCRSSRPCTPGPAGTSRRTSARTCAARAPPTTSACWSR